MIRKLFFFFILSAFGVLFAQSESHLYLEGASITGIRKDGNSIWVSTYGQGIFQYNIKEDKWNNYSTKAGNLENDLFYNIAVNKDFVWAGSGDGLFTYDKKKNQWRKRKFAQGGEMGNWIRALYYDQSDNMLWIGRFKNLTIFDIDKQKFTDFDMTQNGDTKTNNFTTIKGDGDSLVWCGSESGLHIFNKKGNINDKASWSFINNNNGFNGDGDAVSIHDMLFENENIWFATDEFVTKEQPQFNIGGVYKFNRKLRWDRISKQNGLPAPGIYCLEKTGNYIWAGVYAFDKNKKKEFGKGLVYINRLNNNVTVVDLNNLNIISPTIQSLYFDGQYLWIGSDKGLVKLNFDEPLAKFNVQKSEQKKETEKPKRKRKN